jgi:hypothetical protein
LEGVVVANDERAPCCVSSTTSSYREGRTCEVGGRGRLEWTNEPSLLRFLQLQARTASGGLEGVTVANGIANEHLKVTCWRLRFDLKCFLWALTAGRSCFVLLFL